MTEWYQQRVLQLLYASHQFEIGEVNVNDGVIVKCVSAAVEKDGYKKLIALYE